MTDPDGPDRPAATTWTTKYRLPIAGVVGVLAALCCWSLFSGGAVRVWIGGAGLVVLIAWAIVFRALVRRGY